MLHTKTYLVGHIGLELNVVVMYQFFCLILLFSASVLRLSFIDYHHCLEIKLRIVWTILADFREFALRVRFWFLRRFLFLLGMVAWLGSCPEVAQIIWKLIKAVFLNVLDSCWSHTYLFVLRAHPRSQLCVRCLSFVWALDSFGLLSLSTFAQVDDLAWRLLAA